MNIAFIDDTPSEHDRMKALLTEYAALSHTDLNLRCFPGAEQFFQDYHPYRYTVIFMDIYMEGMSGLEAARKLRKTDSEALLVFLTTSLDHMPDAFHCHAYEYITKPFSRERLFQILDDILKRKVTVENCLSFFSNWQHCSLPYSEIAAVASSGHRTDITDRRGQSYATRTNFSAISGQLLEDSRFLLILRGTLVNMDYVVRFAKCSCYLENGLCLPVNVRKSAILEQTWENYVFARLRKETGEGGFSV